MGISLFPKGFISLGVLLLKQLPGIQTAMHLEKLVPLLMVVIASGTYPTMLLRASSALGLGGSNSCLAPNSNTPGMTGATCCKANAAQYTQYLERLMHAAQLVYLAVNSTDT